MLRKTILFLLIGVFFCAAAPTLEHSAYKSARIRQIAHQRDVLAACLVLEAAGEGADGMMAVMNVIANRAGNNPLHFYKEATRPMQFSALNSAKGWPWRNYAWHIQKARQSRMWEFAQVIVAEACAGNLPDLTAGATHYYAASLSGAPSWADEMATTLVLKQHTFLRAPSWDPISRRAALAGNFAN